MLERFFNGPKSPEEIENHLRKIIRGEFDEAVNSPTINLAFQKAKSENQERGFGLTNNHLLNLVKEGAMDNSTSIEDIMYGGREATLSNIDREIEHIRNGLSEEDRKS